jgi:hypothetical protein
MVRRPRQEKPSERPAATRGEAAARTVATTVHLAPEAHAFLYDRGARTDRHRSPFNASRVLARTVARYQVVLEQSDPVAAGSLTETEHEAAVRLLPEPWELTTTQIRYLDRVLASAPELERVLGKLGLKRDSFLGTIAALTPAQKARLVDDAELRWAPRRAVRRAE